MLSFDTYHKAKNLSYPKHIENLPNKSDKLPFWQVTSPSGKDLLSDVKSCYHAVDERMGSKPRVSSIFFGQNAPHSFFDRIGQDCRLILVQEVRDW